MEVPGINNSHRSRAYIYLHKNFSKLIMERHGLKYSFRNVEKMSKNVEKSCYNHAVKTSKEWGIISSWENKKFIRVYLDNVRKVVANMTYTPNAVSVLERIKSGELLPRDIVSKHHRELYPEEWEKRDAYGEELFLSRLPPDMFIKRESDGMFKCFKCKSKKTEYTQLQTRSSDEPMTQFIRCIDCGNRWRN